MDPGSPEKSTCSDQTRQSYSLMSPEFNNGVPYYWTTPHQPRITESEEPQSFVAMMNAIVNSDPHQIGTSFPRTQLFAPIQTSNLGPLQSYLPPNNMSVETPTSIRAVGDQGGFNAPFNVPKNYGINSTIGGSSTFTDASSSRAKGKMICQDVTVPNPDDHIMNYFNREGFSLYDERYEALGLPVDPHLRFLYAAMYKNGGKN